MERVFEEEETIEEVTLDVIEDEGGWISELKLFGKRVRKAFFYFDFLIPQFNYFWAQLLYASSARAASTDLMNS